MNITRNGRFLFVCGVALFIVVSALFLSNESASQKLRPLILPEDYFLHSGDLVVVVLSGGVYFSYEAVITPEGKLFIQIPTEVEEKPFEIIEEVVVSGFNLTQAEELLTQCFLRYFKDVEVSINIIQPGRFSVFVGGEVVRPGVYEATSLMRVSQVLDGAGLKGNASRSRIELLRDAERVPVDLCKFQIEGNPQTNPFLRDGDVIFVPEMETSVTVKGAVYGTGVHSLRVSELTAEQTRVSEGTYELLSGERLSDVLKKAGGAAPWADLQNGYLERSSSGSAEKVRTDLDLKEILSGRDIEADIFMKDGDILVIPPLEENIYVIGAVSNPGAFDYQSTLSVMNYIGLAGGPTSRANSKRIHVLRADGTRIAISLGTNSPGLVQGDAIIVPEVTLKWWQDYVTILTVFSSVVISWLVLAK